ncbi:MAG: GNAT family N-acetyltransferase [Verrucomicrobia bacterium]|nr:GNAT family N-acetyltransferase [Verrucomicrobiota bacterium]
MIRCARADEYDAIQRFLEDAYKAQTDYFPRHNPAVWRPETTNFQRIFMITEGNRIASLVRVFPLELKQHERRIRCDGIGAVATAPWARGKGHMCTLLNHAIDHMKTADVPLSILWGNRHRYRTFGYETAGKVAQLPVTKAGLAKSGIPAISARTYQGETDVLDQIRIAYERQHYCRVRRPHEYPLIYQAQELQVFWSSQGEFFGYLVIRGHSSSVAEFGGQAETVLGMVGALLDTLAINELFFRFPANLPIPAPYHAAASGWSLWPAGMIKVLDLPKTLSLLALPGDEAWGRLSEPEQTEKLFGTLGPSPGNIVVGDLDTV